MSYRTQRPNAVAWFLQKPLVSLQQLIDSVDGYRVPFSERRAILVLVDGVLVLLAVWLSFILWEKVDSGITLFAPERLVQSWYWFAILLTGWWVLAWLNDLYDIPSSYHSLQNLVRVLVVAALALFFYLFIYFSAPVDALPRTFFLSFLLLSSVFVTLWRWIYKRLSQILPFPHRVLIVGTGNRARTIAQTIGLAPGINYDVVGYVDALEESTHEHTEETPLSILGEVEELTDLVDMHKVHEVIIALEGQLGRGLFDFLVDCQTKGVYVSWMPNLYEKLLRRIPVQHIDPAWALQATSSQPILGRSQMAFKRLLDIVIVLMALPTLLILIPLVGMCVWLDSGGPVFYRQMRSGRGGKPFPIYKFRTMTVNAEEDGKPRWATADDNRVTRVGRFLRPTRLDELPQVLNILRGDMSVVGPRPERPEFVQKLQEEIPYYRARLMVKPGLTGWAQIHYRYGNTNEDAQIKLQYDFYYIRYWSIWLDVYTIFRTFGAVLRLEGM